jgi:TetR/AcrR family transcriptional regulator
LRRREKGKSLNKALLKGAVRAGNERAILAAAEEVFAEAGYGGATTAAIAARAGVAKANLHYYFATKEALYRAVIEQVLTAWLEAAESFDISDDPAEALALYIGAKMDLARTMPLGSRIWASEIMRGAPVIQDFLESTLTQWIASRSKVVRRWIAQGKVRPIEPKYLFYMIWATTQHYANAAHEIATLENGQMLDNAKFEAAKRQVIETIVLGLGAK